MMWQIRVSGQWVCGEVVRGVVRHQYAEVCAVPSQLSGLVWRWNARGVKGTDPMSGTEPKFGDAIEKAEEALKSLGIILDPNGSLGGCPVTGM